MSIPLFNAYDYRYLRYRGRNIFPQNRSEIGYFSLESHNPQGKTDESSVEYREDCSQLCFVKDPTQWSASGIENLAIDLHVGIDEHNFVPYIGGDQSEKVKGLLRWLTRHSGDEDLQATRNQVKFVLVDVKITKILTTPYKGRQGEYGWKMIAEKVDDKIYCFMDEEANPKNEFKVRMRSRNEEYRHERLRRFLQNDLKNPCSSDLIDPNNEFVSVQTVKIGGVNFLHGHTVTFGYPASDNPRRPSINYCSFFEQKEDDPETKSTFYTRLDSLYFWARNAISMTEKVILAISEYDDTRKFFKTNFPTEETLGDICASDHILRKVKCIDIDSIPQIVQNEAETRGWPAKWSPEISFGFWVTLFEHIERHVVRQSTEASYRITFSGSKPGTRYPGMVSIEEIMRNRPDPGFKSKLSEEYVAGSPF